MLKTIQNYFRQRREQKLRKEILYKFGFNSSTYAINAWVEFILDGTATKEILLSTAERWRMEEIREQMGAQRERPQMAVPHWMCL